MADRRKKFGRAVLSIWIFLSAVVLFVISFIHPLVYTSSLSSKPLSNLTLSFRRIKNTPSLLKAEEIEAILEGAISRIKAVVFDMDGTLSEDPIAPADPEVIAQIVELANLGIHVGIVSGAYAERMGKVLFDNFPADFRGQEFIHIYAYGGTKGYPLGGNNKVNVNEPYYEYRFTERQQRIVDEAIGAFKERYGTDFEAAINHSSKTTIRLWKHIERSDEVFEGFVSFLKAELERRGAPELIVNAGGTKWGMDILVVDKSASVEDLISRIPGIKAENIMVVADSFSGLAGNDKSLVLPGMLVFNVGKHEGIPQGIYSLDKKGPVGTMELISIFLELLGE